MKKSCPGCGFELLLKSGPENMSERPVSSETLPEKIRRFAVPRVVLYDPRDRSDYESLSQCPHCDKLLVEERS